MLLPNFHNKGAILSECRQYRYMLWRIWDESKPCLMFIMLNPSFADENVEDTTIRKCVLMTNWLGYGGIYVGNLFSFRSYNPAELKKAVYRNVDIIGKDNDLYLQRVSEKCEKIIFAWGNNGVLFNRCDEVEKLFPDAYCIALTKAGNPKHPLYVSGSVKLCSYVPPTINNQ